MNDRFKYRIALHQNKYEEYGLEKFKNQRIFEVKSLNIGYENSTVEIITEYSNGDWAVREIDIEDVDLMQCTGLKDKNGKLIYEGDIVIEHYYNTKETAIKKVFFDEKAIGFAYTDGIEYNQLSITDGNRLQVIGNIYENKYLLESEGIK